MKKQTKDTIVIYCMLIGMFGFILSIVIFDLFSPKNIFSLGGFVAILFVLLFVILIKTKDSLHNEKAKEK